MHESLMECVRNYLLVNAPKQDVSLSVSSHCIGWYFWNYKTDTHDKLSMRELKEQGFSVQDLRDLRGSMLKIDTSWVAINFTAKKV